MPTKSCNYAEDQECKTSRICAKKLFQKAYAAALTLRVG